MDNFIKYALIRCIRTICQTAGATIGSAVVFTDVNWPMVISASLLAGILSILTSVATGLPEADICDEEMMEDENFEEEVDEEDDDE